MMMMVSGQEANEVGSAVWLQPKLAVETSAQPNDRLSRRSRSSTSFAIISLSAILTGISSSSIERGEQDSSLIRLITSQLTH